MSAGQSSGTTRRSSTSSSTRTRDPPLVPDRLGRLVDPAVGAEDQEAVEAAGEPPVVGHRDDRAVEGPQPLLERFGAVEVPRAAYRSLLDSALSSAGDFFALDVLAAAGDERPATMVSGPISGKLIAQLLTQTS